MNAVHKDVHVAKSTLQQDVWNAAYEATGDSALADDIADRFTAARSSSRRNALTLAERKAIEADLTSGGLSYSKLRDKHGVGISTIQRIASDLRSRGVTVRTAGQTSPGNALPKGSRGGVANG